MSHRQDRSVFLAAVGVLERRGWVQGRLRDQSSGGVCLLGALDEAQGFDAMRSPVKWVRAQRRLSKLGMAAGVAPTPSALTAWQDRPGRTVEDVVLVLKRAARGERAK